MPEDHWKPFRLMTLLPFLFLSGVFLLKECNGQAGSNFFYFYSPTQRTHSNNGLVSGSGQIFDNPYFSQNQPQANNQQQPVEDEQQRQQPQNLPFPTAASAFRQSTVLGYHQPQFHRGGIFSPAPPAQLQYPLVAPTPAYPQSALRQQASSPAFTTFTNFGNNANLLGLPQPSQSSFLATQAPLGTVSPGTFSFFQSPFQYLQERVFHNEPPTPTPEGPALRSPTSTAIPPPAPPSPTPAAAEEVNDPVQQVGGRKQKFSSRFRYVEQPTLIRQYSPYSQLNSPYTSDLPYTEQRFYSSPTSPTGYAFSVGDAGHGATSTVHFSLGPLSNIQQYHKEITATRKKLQSQRIEKPITEVAEAPVTPVETVVSQDAPSPPAEPTISTTMSPLPQIPEITAGAMNTTLEPLLKESSFHTETIASPNSPLLPQRSRKISETNIPKRLVIRKKVARKRLRLDGSAEVTDTNNAAPVMIRRIASPNRLPIDETNKFENESPKGPIDTSADVAHNAPSDVVPSVEPPSTTAAPIQSQVKQAEQVNKNQDGDEYYEEYYEDEAPAPPKSPQNEGLARERVMTAVMASPPESDADLPILDGVTKGDFPGVFSHDNAVERSEGEYVVSRITASHPAADQNGGEMAMPPPDVATPSSTTTTTTTTTEAVPPVFSREDPAEEQPPAESEELPVPLFRPRYRSTTATTTTSTTTEAAPVITTTAGPISSSTELSQDSAEYPSGELHSDEGHNDQPPPSPAPPQENLHEASSTTELSPHSEDSNILSSTEPTSQEHSQVQNVVNEQDSAHTVSSTESTSNEHVEGQSAINDHDTGTVASSTESTSQEHVEGQIVMNEKEAGNEEVKSEFSASSSTETVISSSTTEDSILIPETEMPSPSSTESVQPENVVASSTATPAPPAASESSPSSTEQSLTQDDTPLHSQEVLDGEDHLSNSQEIPSDSEEIGRAQRVALEETLRRLREKQLSSTEPHEQLENTPENEVQNGRRVFSRKPLQLTNLPLPTSGTLPKVNAVLDEEDGVDRRQVIEKIQRFRQNSRGTTTKRPRRVTRPSSASERRIAVVVPVEELLGRQEQVDSYSDSSSTPGPAVEPPTTVSLPSFRPRIRTTPSTTTTVLPDESSTTPATLTEEEEMMINYPALSSTSTETYTTATTPLPPTLTRIVDNEISSTTQSMLMVDEMSSTTEIDIEPITTRSEPVVTPRTRTITRTRTTPSTTTTTTEETYMTTTTPVPILPMTTVPSSRADSKTMTDNDADMFDDNYALIKNDDDVFYEENVGGGIMQVSSSTEQPSSTEAIIIDNTPSSTTTTSTTTPPSSTDPVYTYLTTPETISNSPAIAITTPFSTTSAPDISSSSTMTTTPAGQLIIHEILPTMMPPATEIHSVIGESFEDDQSSAVDTNNSANLSDELLAADKAGVRVITNVLVSTNQNVTKIDNEGASGELQSSFESQEVTQPLSSNPNGESGEGGLKRVRVVVRKQRRQRRPGGEGQSSNNGEGRRRRRKVLHRRQQ